MDSKTNAQRLTEKAGVKVAAHAYDPDACDGMEVARLTCRDASSVFKTLVTQGAKGGFYVFVVPVCRELDLKAAAKAVGEKSVEMIKQAKLLPLTGYVHGGCSPIGMKKKFMTVIDASAESLPVMLVSAGRRGLQLELAPNDLRALTDAVFAPVT